MFSSKTKKRGQLPVFPTHHMVCPVGNYTRVVPRFVFMIYPNVFVLMPLAAAHVSMAEPDGQVIVTPSGSLPSTSPQRSYSSDAFATVRSVRLVQPVNASSMTVETVSGREMLVSAEQPAKSCTVDLCHGFRNLYGGQTAAVHKRTFADFRQALRQSHFREILVCLKGMVEMAETT